MFLSIIIPVYNADLYIEECLNSCINQDIPYEDYEIICINDGSTDHSQSILTSYSMKYPNIRVIEQANSGVSMARNAGMNIAQGEYYWFVDADDFIQQNCLSLLQNNVQSTQCDCLSFGLKYFNVQLSEEEARQKELGIVKYSILGGAQPACLLRSGCLKEIRWKPGIEVGEDAIFISQFKMTAQTYAELPTTLYYYRQQPNSALHKIPDFYKRLHSHVNGAIIMRDLYLQNGGQTELNANTLMTFLVYATSMVAKKYTEESKLELSRLHEANLFPYRKPKECSKKNAYATNRTDLVGKIFNYLCMKSVTRTGLLALRVWYKLFSLVKR